jgi:hypothetical protein
MRTISPVFTQPTCHVDARCCRQIRARKPAWVICADTRCDAAAGLPELLQDIVHDMAGSEQQQEVVTPRQQMNRQIKGYAAGWHCSAPTTLPAA